LVSCGHPALFLSPPRLPPLTPSLTEGLFATGKFFYRASFSRAGTLSPVTLLPLLGLVFPTPQSTTVTQLPFLSSRFRPVFSLSWPLDSSRSGLLLPDSFFFKRNSFFFLPRVVFSGFGSRFKAQCLFIRANFPVPTRRDDVFYVLKIFLWRRSAPYFRPRFFLLEFPGTPCFLSLLAP